MDYRGQRLVVQSILPGIIQSNTMGARLMLGALELGSRLKVSFNRQYYTHITAYCP
jgi:hypothetical protein